MPDLVAFASNPNPWYVEAGGPEVLGHPQLHREFQASVDMRDPVSKQAKIKQCQTTNRRYIEGLDSVSSFLMGLLSL